jgi:hypothetical protein
MGSFMEEEDKLERMDISFAGSALIRGWRRGLGVACKESSVGLLI